MCADVTGLRKTKYPKCRKKLSRSQYDKMIVMLRWLRETKKKELLSQSQERVVKKPEAVKRPSKNSSALKSSGKSSNGSRRQKQGRT